MVDVAAATSQISGELVQLLQQSRHTNEILDRHASETDQALTAIRNQLNERNSRQRRLKAAVKPPALRKASMTQRRNPRKWSTRHQ